MRILHVNDVASVASRLVEASQARDTLYQPVLRRRPDGSTRAATGLALARLNDWHRVGQAFYAGGYSHLHIHYASFAALGAGRRFSLHLHGGDLLEDTVRGAKGRLTRWGIRHAVKIAVSTPDLLVAAQPWRADAVYIPNPMPVSATAARPSGRDEPELMLVSKMDPRKGWARQVTLVRELRRAVPHLRVVFPSHGRLPPAAREALSQQLVALGGTPLPPMTRDAFVARMRQADLVLGQLEVGALGMSELEAMAAGVPTIAEVHAYRGNGALPPVVLPDDAVRAADALLRSQAQWVDAGYRARCYIEETHAPRTVLGRLEQLLEPVAM